MDCFGYTLHMSKPNVTRVQSATQWTASVHTLHMSKPNVTRVQSATQWTASVHTVHMSKPNVTRVQSATQWTASVHTVHMSKPNVTRVQSATQWTASVHTLRMSKGQFVAKSRVQGKSFKAHTGGVDSAWQLLKELIPKSVSTRAKGTAKFNSKIHMYIRAWQWRWENTAATNLCKKNGNGIPAQERHLRKESGKMATEIAPKLRF